MAVSDYGAIVFEKGKRIEIPELNYYYNKKQKKYVGAEVNETTEDMFNSFLKQNGNVKCPPNYSTVIPLDNKCLMFYKNLEPTIFVNGNISKLYKLDNGFLKDHSGEILLSPFFTDEFDSEIIGYEVSYKEQKYLVIYGYLLNEYDRKHLIKMIEKRLSYNEEMRNYFIDATNCDYYLLLEYTMRKDMKRSALKRIFKTIKSKGTKDEIIQAFNDWWMLH